jgi:signal transduction histidine kinase
VLRHSVPSEMSDLPSTEAAPSDHERRDQSAPGDAPVLFPWLEAGQALLNPERRILGLSDDLARWFQRHCSEPVGQLFDDMLGALVPAWPDLAAASWAAATPFARCSLRVSSNGAAAWYEVEFVKHEAGWCLRIQSVLPPLAELSETPWNAYLAGEREQRQMFIRLLRAEAQLGNLMRSWPGVIFSQRADFSFQFASPRIGDLTGIPVEQWLNQARNFWPVVHEADAEEVHQHCLRAAKARTGVTTTFRLRNLETGRVAHVLEHRQAVVSATGVVICYEGFWLDVTREKIAERRLSSAAWKETLATLTMGLAHDFSNILAGILSLSEGFIAQMDATHPFAPGLTLIRQNAWQACQLVQRMMSLHRCQTGEQNYHDLNETLTELADLVQRVLPRRIIIETELAPQQLPLYVDAVELRQVILNLALNAAEAMPQRGKLVFQTRLCETAPPPTLTQGQFPRLPCVRLSARDTGSGIAPRHLPFVFDPFFTTKPVNKGSGLGLYNARLFAERHRGAISVTSQEGVGTEFCLWLPLADFSEAERVQSAVVQQRPSILLAGEAGLLQDSTAEFLRVHGYYVMQVFAPERAKDVLAGEDNHFRAVMILAGPTESAFLELIGELRQQHPALLVILQLVGGEPDRIPTDLLPQLHLLIANAMSEADMVRNLKRLFD